MPIASAINETDRTRIFWCREIFFPKSEMRRPMIPMYMIRKTIACSESVCTLNVMELICLNARG